MNGSEEIIRKAAEVLADPVPRPRDGRGRPGGLLDLPAGGETLIIGDLHACAGNLDLILAHRANLAALREGRLQLLFLGDAAHNDVRYREMASSIPIMETILGLIADNPGRVFYLRGNHDSFDGDVTKGGVRQGLEHHAAVLRLRGGAYLEALRDFFEALPLAALGEGFLALHAGPPRGGCRRQDLIEALSSPELAAQLVWNRSVLYPGWPAFMSYSENDCAAARRGLGLSPATPVIVGHTPLDDIGLTGGFWRNAFGYADHHILFSAARSRAPYLSFRQGRFEVFFAGE